MANLEDNEIELDSGFTLVQRKNMRRGKPPQQIYRPGSGPLRKSNTGIDELESDSSVVDSNSRNKQSKNPLLNDEIRYEGSSSNKASTQSALRTDDVNSRRQKKPEQMLYVPRPMAQAREISSSRDLLKGRNSHLQSNGDKYEMNDRFGNNRGKRFTTDRKQDNEDDFRDDWSNKSNQVNFRPRQGSEPRGMGNGPAQHWQRNRDRDTRSVEPSVNPRRGNFAEKMRSKPPSGRRHSVALGAEHHDKRPFNKPPNMDNVPPRFRKKFLIENNVPTSAALEEGWDGASLTFQGHIPKGHGFQNQQQAGGANFGGSGYFTLPGSRPRGRGRFQHDLEVLPGPLFRSATPDRVKSPCGSRPATPPLGVQGGRARTPTNEMYDSYNEDRKSLFNDRLRNIRRGVPRSMANDDEQTGYEKKDRNSGDRRPNRRENNERGGAKFLGGRDNNRDRKTDQNYNRDNRDNRDSRRETPVRDTRRNKDSFGYAKDNKAYCEGYNRERRREDRREQGSRRSRSGDNGGDFIGRSQPVRYDDKISSGGKGNNGDRDCLVGRGLGFGSEVQLSPVSPPTPEEKSGFASMPVAATTLDWSEEVELNDPLEAEALSDALTRSSSVTSLQEISLKSLPANINQNQTLSNRKSKRKTRRRSKQRGGHREGSNSRTRLERGNRSRRNSTNNGSTTEHSHRRETSFERKENWREEIVRSRRNSEREQDRKFSEPKTEDIKGKKAGILVLPTQKAEFGASNVEHPKFPETKKSQREPYQKRLFDPNNPSKPIIVKSASSRAKVPGFSENCESAPPQIKDTNQFGVVSRPAWYNENSEEFRSCHYPELLRDIRRADDEIQQIVSKGLLLVNWGAVNLLRQFLGEALEFLLCKNIKFCQAENVEQHLWKVLYHNIIEVTRKAVGNDPENKENYKAFLLYLIDEGTKYFEGLIVLLEETYRFKFSDYLGNSLVQHKGLGLVGLALVSAQKLFLFLGDLLRYREQVNETSNYGKCRQWYIKSYEINPKNGKPYNQLALLAVYARRKLDAVYYYMRSLMSSNPVPSARESLISLFDENRKKYEQSEKKRREERVEKHRQQMKQKESEDVGGPSNSLRKETWIHPEGGRRVHRTTQATHEQKDSDEEDSASLSSVEVNKRFVISYLHVHGKLITKIGMETFQETAMQMLKEFRALLQHSPVPLPCNRFLQLLALNMFAIESTQLKDPHLQNQSGYRSEFQERALVVSLQMFNLILERCVSILQEHMSPSKDDLVGTLPQDANVLLPAIKVWCDWMLFHTKIWNPPPSTLDFKMGTTGDAWTRLATLMNLLEQMDPTDVSSRFSKDQKDGYEAVRLPEDSVLSGFTPLMYTIQDQMYAPKDLDSELAEFSLRLKKLLFFGTIYLCGLEPPVLKLEIEDGVREYVSVVCASNRDSPPSPQDLVGNDDILLESFSSEEEESGRQEIDSEATTEIRNLLTRKVELEKRSRNQELHMQRVKKILSQSVVSVHMEVRPKYLVPDTNCFIDHLAGIRTIAQSHCYTLMVPIVVLSELEGLSKGGKTPAPGSRTLLDPQHVRKVAAAAREALDFLRRRHASVKCVTTKGAILASAAFSTEEDAASADGGLKNDDKILTTCLVMGRPNREAPAADAAGEGEPRRLARDVVLLTEDRNLRVKAHAMDVPVRELPDFARWAGLG